jgi:hypothetical protein
MGERISCLTQEQLIHYLNHAHAQREDSLRAGEHLAACRSCREALRKAAAGAMERWMQVLDRDQEPDDCLDSEMLLAYVRDQADAVVREIVELHVEECAVCLEDLRSLQAFHTEMAGYLPAPPESAAGERFSMNPRTLALEKARSWLDQMQVSISRSRETLRIPAASLSFASDDQYRLRQTLTFDDEKASGSFYMEGDKRWLHIEHAVWPAGTLVLLEVPNAQDRIAWRRFAVLRKGWRVAVAELEASSAPIDNRYLKIGQIPAERLPEQAEEALKNSFEAAAIEDPAALPAWQQWASSALTQPLQPAILRVVQQIVGSRE